MDPDRMLYNSIAAVFVGSVLTFLSAWHWFHRNAAVREAERLSQERHELANRVTDLEAKLASVSQTVVPMSAAFQAILVRELTHFHTPVMDALLVKLGPPMVLTPEEEEQLIEALAQRMQDMGDQISDSERDAAMMLPAVMRRVKAELAAPMPVKVELQTVTLPPVEESKKAAPEK